MNLDHIRTFVEVAACGNFHRAAESLHVTQSTVSARIRVLEDHFGLPLFRRGRSGVELTAAGHQFRRYALNLQHFWKQAYQAVTLPRGYRAVFSLAAQVSLWDRLILPWIPWMRAEAPDVALRVDADYSTSQMRLLSDGLLDVGVMYQARQTPGLHIDKLFDETLVLVSTRPRAATAAWVEDYVYVDWGDVFREAHTRFFPDLETPAVSVGLGALGLQHILTHGGSGYFPLRVVQPLLDEERLHRIDEAPSVERPAYVVYSETPASPDLVELALEGLRTVGGGI
jgi:DNA-binding transcriptional LysR family regulator